MMKIARLNPDLLVRGMDPRIRIRIHTTMSWIRNSGYNTERLLVFFLPFQPPIVILNVLVVEAEGLEAKDANGFREGGDGRPFFF
jgi:hypothetical protein